MDVEMKQQVHGQDFLWLSPDPSFRDGRMQPIGNVLWRVVLRASKASMDRDRLNYAKTMPAGTVK